MIVGMLALGLVVAAAALLRWLCEQAVDALKADDDALNVWSDE